MATVVKPFKPTLEYVKRLRKQRCIADKAIYSYTLQDILDAQNSLSTLFKSRVTFAFTERILLLHAINNN